MAQRFLLDTHVAVDLGGTGGFESLPLKVRMILENEEMELFLSVVSDVEIAIKNGLGKLSMNREELAIICEQASIVSYPLRRRHGDRLFTLPSHHKDPFDRMIIATTLSDDLPVISGDREFRKYKGLKVIWG